MQSQEHNRLLLNMDSTLYKAARSGNIDSLNGVLGGNPAALDQVTPEKNTALHLAASAYENDQKKRRIGKIKFVQCLLQLNPKLSLIQNDKGNTALHEAAQVGLSDVVKVFLTRQPDLINICNEFQETPLFKAAERGHGNTALHEAAQVGLSDVVKVFLTRQPDLINIGNVFQDTPLFKAAEGGHVETVLEILQHSSPLQYVTEKTLDCRTCLHVAVVGGHLGIPWMFDAEVVKVLLNKARDQAIQLVEDPDKYGNRALHLAVCGDHLHIVKQLLKLEPQLCYNLNENGESPLHIAVKLGFLRIVKVLIENKPDSIEVGSKDGKNILHMATEARRLHIVKYLVEKEKVLGLSRLINQHDDSKGKPLHETSEANIDKEPKTSSDNKWCEKGGDTPLHIAARNKTVQILEMLLKVQGVNASAMNDSGLTPLDIARGNTEYYESYRIPEMLVNFPSKKKPFLYSTPDVTEAKHKNFSNFVQSAFKQRTNSELVVAGLLATVSFTAAFTIPGGFSQNGTPLLISRLSFKVFLVLDIMAFFLSLFVALMWQLNSPISTGDMMCFMTGTSLLVCVSFACIANSFVAAVHVVLSSEEVKTLAWSVLGICLFICFCGEVGFVYATAKFLVKQARIRRLLGLQRIDDKFVEYAWTNCEECGLLDTLRKWEQKAKEGRSNPSKGAATTLSKKGEGSLDDSHHPSKDLLCHLRILNSLSGSLTSTCACLNLLVMEITKYLKDAAKGMKDWNVGKE
eukprot:Gb_40389 [translate_table: standard]